MYYDEYNILSTNIRACNAAYWLGTWRDGSTVWYIPSGGGFGEYLWYGNNSGTRPVVVISRDKLIS